MKYSKEERLQIGKEIYTHEISISAAANKYNVNPYTARDYMREYRDTNNLPPMDDGAEELKIIRSKKKEKIDLSKLNEMTKDELIDEVIKAKVETERAKKGYAVKGGGQEKEFISLYTLNTK